MRIRSMLPGWFLLIALWAFSAHALADSAGAVWPEPGKTTKTGGKLVVDASHMDEGYILCRVKKANKHKLKLRITMGKETLTYDLNGKGEDEVFPLQLGSGKYGVALFENVSGKKYSQAGKVSLSVKLVREDAAYLAPNQYVHYLRGYDAVAKSDELCAGLDELHSYEAVCGFMKSSFVYDYIRAATITAGMLPDIEGAYAKKMGICQDLAAITCCMLRVAGIPARMVIGYADRQYHAWTVTEIGGKEHFFDPTAAISALGKVKSYTVERMY